VFAASFAATVAVLVPAAWHGTEATIEKDGKRIRPLQKEFSIGDVRVTVDVDHSLIRTGDPVVAKLRAYADQPTTVDVDLTVLQSDDAFGSRVAAPPRAIDKEHFTLEAKPDGGKIVDTRLVMTPNHAIDKFDWFRIFVAPRGAEVDSYGGEDDGGGTAAISVLGVSDNDFDISIHPKGKLTSGAPFEVAVRVENTSTHALTHTPYIHLGTAVGLYNIEQGDDFDIEEQSDDENYEDHPKKFKIGAVETVKFTVTPKRPDIKTVTFVASAYSWDEEPGPVADAAFEAKTFKVKPAPAEAPVKEVAAK
jgi:hypothetical protein